MQYTSHYQSPLGQLLLAADDKGLVGIWFERQKYYAKGLANDCTEQEIPILRDTKRWLDQYFAGKAPNWEIPIHFIGTEFQKEVWKILKDIPYGHTTTYGKIARILARQRGITRMSAQAVGNAVGRNPIAILVPCHRVLGTRGNLTGYAAGIETKKALLKLEQP